MYLLPPNILKTMRTVNEIMTISKPTQNVGKLKHSIEPDRMPRPKMDPGLKPAMIPKGIPKTRANSMAAVVSSNVAGRRSNISLSAGRLCTNEFPNSPFTAFFKKTVVDSDSARTATSRGIGFKL